MDNNTETKRFKMMTAAEALQLSDSYNELDNLLRRIHDVIKAFYGAWPELALNLSSAVVASPASLFIYLHQLLTGDISCFDVGVSG